VVFIAFAVVLLSVWLKLVIFCASAAADPPVKPAVAGFAQVNTLPVSCVFGIKEIGVPLQIVSYLLASEITGVGLIVYVSVCVLVQPFCATIFTRYGTLIAAVVVFIKLSLIKLAVPAIAPAPKTAALLQVQPSVLIAIDDAAEKLILLPQPTDTVFQVAVLLIVGLGNTETTIVYFVPKSSVTL